MKTAEIRRRFLAHHGPRATARDFHEWYLGMGTVPAGYLGKLA